MKQTLSYRRKLLDQLLEQQQFLLKGFVLDLGGERVRKRGYFQPFITKNITRWLTVNIDPVTLPDIVLDAHYLPLSSNSFDSVLCCEVLEHVQKPALCISEVLRVLKPQGVFIFSVPFLFPIHADPFDYSRFTYEGVQNIGSRFSELKIIPMGSTWGTMGMLLNLASRDIKAPLFRRGIRVIGRALTILEMRKGREHDLTAFSTGYFCVAKK